MTIYIPIYVYCQIQELVRNCEFEISWIGKIRQFEDGFIIEKIKLIQQEVSPVSTILRATDLGTAYQEIITEEGSLTGWKLWGHSHAKMGVFWSGTDVATIMDFDNETTNNNWFLSIEFNHKMEWLCRLDVFTPTHLTKHIGHLEIVGIESQEISDYCKTEIANKVYVKKVREVEPEPAPPKFFKGKDPLTEMIDKIKNKQKTDHCMLTPETDINNI